ncbi:CUE domain-containing protein 1 [Bombus terrestris]|uniref:CUE domain-containing protein 1 n=1 Tax=Bombus terrestris TaxID=30195 RepID=A0A9B7D028_BOMTE|nr:CUE domain-containing protein 1 [Bombus terrestris]XP_012173157.1 CUE domain-containing protein 1 [Bombus terrestris]XP_012173158.1 CUE domain-containing protein 1 [Bombus terrestris]XP_020722862.1 CUE domain-containing protein 1 [Bombus terrestris]
MASAMEQQQQQQQQTTLEFYQAMADFKNMFPQMDDDVIEAVLRSNQGAVDTTIDQLLTMSTDNENEKIRSELEQNEKSPSTSKSQKTESTISLKSIRKWQPALLGPLPDTFLRLPQQVCEDSLDSSYLQENSMLEDERIAIFLQNEEFMAELRWNEDFLSTLENDTKIQGTSLEKCGNQIGHDDEDLFKERLKNMGKVSRRKFAQLTKVFTRSKKRGGRQLLPPTASCDDLLDPEESSRFQS